MVESICVFCGSGTGKSSSHAHAAAGLGALLAETGRTLVYGGSNVGLMKILADAGLEAGGRVVGVMVDALVEKEVAHSGLSEMHIVGTMSERKAMMADLSDAFVALPGGIGTLDELFEIWTWSQLGLHRKPFGMLNVDGFFGPLLTYLSQVADQRFMRPEHLEMLLVDEDPRRLLDRMDIYRFPDLPKWIDGEAGRRVTHP